MTSDRFTQVVLVTVAGLVGVGKACIEWSRLVGLDFLFHLLRHLQLVDFSRQSKRNEQIRSKCKTVGVVFHSPGCQSSVPDKPG